MAGRFSCRLFRLAAEDTEAFLENAKARMGGAAVS